MLRVLVIRQRIANNDSSNNRNNDRNNDGTSETPFLAKRQTHLIWGPRGNSEGGPRGPREILKGAPGAIN